MSEWITWERNRARVTRRRLDRQPYGACWTPRDATPDEAAEAIAAEKSLADSIKARQDFEARQEWADAEAIRGILEMMTHESHPLDRLSAEEWAAFRRRLEGC